MSEFTEDITTLLQDWKDGRVTAGEDLIRTVYLELKKISNAYLQRDWHRDITLQSTELVNEAFIRLVGQKDVEWQDRAHFFGIAAKLMRQILIEYLRNRKAQKRGGGESNLVLDEELNLSDRKSVDLLELDEALQELERIDYRKCRLVEYRFFAGLTIDETAEVMGISTATVKREWNLAKAWLFRYLSGP